MSENEVTTGIGLRHVRVALRDDDGTILVPSGTPHNEAYRGLRISGALGLTPTIPDPQRVTARGDDRAYHTFQLPPTETPTGDLRVSKTNLDVIALLTGTLNFGSGDRRKVGLATDEQGDEPEIVLWGCRQGIDSEEGSVLFGQRIWQTYVFLNALATLRPSAMEDAAVSEFVYSLVANDATVDENGHTFTVGHEGFTKAAYVLVVTKNKYMLDAFLGDAVHRTFTLSETPVSGQALSVYEDGVLAAVTTDYTVTTNVLTFVGGNVPTNDAKIMVEYEYV